MVAAGFHWADYLIFVVFLTISLSIGVYHALSGGRQRTTSEFIMADRNLKLIPVALSLVMSITSAIIVMGVNCETSTFGFVYGAWHLITIIPACLLAQYLVVWLYPIQLTSAYEYFERRFKSRATRHTAFFLGVLSSVVYIGIAMYAPSIALEAVSPVPMKVSVPVMALLATTYTALGGMKAVIWTDVYQGIVMLAGLFAVMIRGWILVEPSAVYSLANEGGRLRWNEWTMDPRVRHSTPGAFVGLTFVACYTFFGSQAAVQRHSAVASLETARKVIVVAAVGFFTLSAVIMVISVNVYGYFARIQCDPLEAGNISSCNQMLPYFVLIAFENYKGFTGLLLAILYSGALSSVSSAMSGSAANLWEDVLKDKLCRNISELKAAFINRILVIFVGLLGMAVAFVCSILPGSVLQLAVASFGVCGGPIFGMFLLGGISRKSNWVGALVGGWSAFSLLAWLAVGAQVNQVRSLSRPLPPVGIDGCQDNETIMYSATNITASDHVHTSVLDDVFMVSYVWYMPLAIIVVILLGLLVSVVTEKIKPSLVDRPIDEVCLIQWRNIFTLAWDPYTAHNKNLKEKTMENGRGGAVEPLMMTEVGKPVSH